MSAEIKKFIHDSFMLMPKEELIRKIQAAENHHNEFCRTAQQWRTAMCYMAEALKPFSDAADGLDEEAGIALQVGGYVPTNEEWATAEVSTKHLYAARDAIAAGPEGLLKKFNDEIAAARLCITALKELEQQGNVLAAQTLTKVRQVDPHI